MDLPLQITFRGLEHSDAIEAHVRKKAEKLETFDKHIVSCHVTVESPHRHKHEGRPYRICINIGVPKDEIVVSHEVGGSSQEDAYAAIDVAFDAAQRKVKDHARVRRGDVKRHGDA